MMPARSDSRPACSSRGFAVVITLVMITLLATASSVLASTPVITSALTASGTVGVAFFYTITATGNPTPSSFNATPLPAGLSVNTSTGVISGIPTTAGTYSVTISATNNSGPNGTGSATLVITIVNPAPPGGLFVGFRLPDFPPAATPAPTPAANNAQLMVQMGANGTTTTANRFNATLEVDASGAGTWVPYSRFVGINDSTSWVTDAPLNVRELPGSAPAPLPYPSPPAFGTAQLTQAPPAVYMKADPRSTRFGIFQMDAIQTSNPSDPLTSRIMRSVWPINDSAVQNGYGGAVGTTFPGPVEHAPLRFGGQPYYPATFSINDGLASSIRNTTTTNYADNDGVIRPADATYPDPTQTATGSSTAYNTADYRPIILNRPFQNVAELGYAFRDLPWKTLDVFTDKGADAGLLDVFSVNDGAPPIPTPTPNPSPSPTPIPSTMVAGRVNLNTRQTPVLQSVLTGAIWDEISSSVVDNTNAPTAQTMATNIANATSAIPMTNKSEIITRAGLATTILPLPTTSQDNQTVKARREVVPRAISSVSQTRVWNVLIDVVAQSGRYKPNATSLQNDFIVEGEQHYWVHVAIDRFTGQVIDKQIEVVNE